MDPKSSTQLDPKLQEAYNRIMGTDTTTQAPGTPPSPTNPTPNPADPSIPNLPPTPDATVAAPNVPEPTLPTPPSEQMPTASPTETVTVVETPTQPSMTTVENTTSVNSQAFSAKKNKKISPVIWIAGGVAFLLVYTLIWVKVFNLQLPFLPQ